MTLSSKRLDLAPNAVHVWQLDLVSREITTKKWEQLLSSEEQARAKRYQVERGRFQYVATRGFLRVVLAHYLLADARSLVLRKSKNDKPELGPPHSSHGLEFNVSHSGDMVLLAFSARRPVGIDVERLRTDLDVLSIARRFFSFYEQEKLQAVEHRDRVAAYFRCWTRKEAFIKANGSGLSLPLDQFDVSITPGDTDALIATRPNSAEAQQWLLRDIPVRPGYAAALCAAGRDWQLEIQNPDDVTVPCDTIGL